MIGKEAFANNKLIEVTIPGSVTSIGDSAFQGNNLSKAIIYGKEVDFGNQVFSSDHKNLELHGHKNSTVEDYANEHSYITFVPLLSITAEVQPANSGTVTGGGTYVHGSEATLTATENASFAFVNWTENDTVVSTSTIYGFEVTSDRDLTANFSRLPSPPPPPPPVKQYTITLSAEPEAGGSVSGGGTFIRWEQATVEALANPGYGFTGWTEDGTYVSTDSSYTFRVSKDRDLVAIFTESEIEDGWIIIDSPVEEIDLVASWEIFINYGFNTADIEG